MKITKLVGSFALLMTIAAGNLWGQAVAEQDEATAALPAGKDILAKHIEAIGGEDKIRSIESSVMKGTFAMPAAGLNAPMTMVVATPCRSSFKMEIEGMGQVLKGTDGKIGWETSPMSGPRLLKDTELSQLLRESDPQADLNPDKYFKSIETVGEEDVDGTKCYKVAFVTKDDQEEIKFYDAETFLVIKSEQTATTPMGDIKVTSTQSDYREIDGMKVPHKIEASMMGQQQVMTIDSMEFNSDLDDSAFEMPDDIKKLVEKKKDKEEKQEDAS